MALTDPLGDMLTRIRNGQQAKKDSVLSPASKLRANVLEVLQREGYIRGYSEDTTGKHPALRIELKYFEGEPAISAISAAAVWTFFLAWLASPTPMLSVIFSRRGTSRRFL